MRQLIALTASMHKAPAHVWFMHASVSAYQSSFLLLTQQERAQGMHSTHAGWKYAATHEGMSEPWRLEVAGGTRWVLRGEDRWQTAIGK